MSTHPTVFITVPKFVAITPIQAATGSAITTIGSTTLPKIKPAPVQTTAEQNNEKAIGDSTTETQPPKSKKRRLDHLTWEEKVQRKKLKNRVAAQTSRDRKKARMEEMEQEIQELTEKTQILVNKCESLQVINDSLLEKNQKLDMELELLRQQLQELQKQQQEQQSYKTITCAGWLKPQGLSVVTGDNHCVKIEKTAEKECNSVVPIACNSSMPSLQDMLLPDIEIDERALDDAEFDAGKLEELAESLLADITADLEASDRASSASDAETTSETERLLGSMVGSTTERLESSQHKIDYHGSCIKPINILINTTQTPTNQTISCSNSKQTPELSLKNKFEEESESAQSPNADNTRTTAALITQVLPEDSALVTVTPDTVYGTYDAKTNSITIVMDDVSIPVSEAVEEIYCEGADVANSSEEVDCTAGMVSPSQVYLNVTTCSDDETEYGDDDINFNFDPIEKFLYPKRPLVSPLAKSPALSLYSATSDHGYESIIGSPSPPSRHLEPLIEDLSNDGFSSWPPGFNELFPSLL